MGPLAFKEEGMIRKIKKYRISVRPFGVLRHLKKQVSFDSGKEPEDSALEEAISKLAPRVSPCALYGSYSRGETPEALKALWQSSPEKSLSLSVIAATIGKPIELEIEKASQAGDPFERALVNSIARESLEQSFHFVERLIGEEAREESCELTPLLPAAAESLEPLLEALDAQKAEITLNDSGQISPYFTGLRYCFWTPVKSKK